MYVLCPIRVDQTLMGRYQMVLDAGRIVSGRHLRQMCFVTDRITFQVEYDTPAALLARQDGYFRSLVDGSSDRMALYAIAGVSL